MKRYIIDTQKWKCSRTFFHHDKNFIRTQATSGFGRSVDVKSREIKKLPSYFSRGSGLIKVRDNNRDDLRKKVGGGGEI